MWYVYIRLYVVCVYENQYLPSSFTYFKKLLNNGFELVLRAFLVVVVVSINFTLLSRALVVVVVVVAHIVVVTLSHRHTQTDTHCAKYRVYLFFHFIKFVSPDKPVLQRRHRRRCHAASAAAPTASSCTFVSLYAGEKNNTLLYIYLLQIHYSFRTKIQFAILFINSNNSDDGSNNNNNDNIAP